MNVRSQKGFSLVELMIVVAIIGILSAIAVPNFQRFQRKARQSEAKSHLSGIYTAEKAFHAEWNTYYMSLSEVGYQPDGNVRYNAGLSAAGGVTAAQLTATYGYPVAAPNATNFNLAALCGAIASCTDMSGGVALPAGNAISQNAFLIGAAGDIGGALDDHWTINQNKSMLNAQNGVD